MAKRKTVVQTKKKIKHSISDLKKNKLSSSAKTALKSINNLEKIDVKNKKGNRNIKKAKDSTRKIIKRNIEKRVNKNLGNLRKDNIKSKKVQKISNALFDEFKKFNYDFSPGSLTDIESIISANIANEVKPDISGNALLIPYIIYSSSPELHRLSYSNGFSIGKLIFKASKKDFGALANALENGGLGKILYNNFEDKAVITALNNMKIHLGYNVHWFEAGMISGYMSANTEKLMDVVETKCSCNGSSRCQFIVTEHGKGTENANPDIAKNLIEDIIKGIDYQPAENKISSEYYLLHLMPMAKEPVFSEVSKLFYISGKRFGKSRIFDENTIISLKNPLAFKEVKIIHSGKKISGIDIIYHDAESIHNVVMLSRAFIIGMLKQMDLKAETKIVKNQNGYIMHVNITGYKK
jgi:predicted hydrocarbon binding protein